MKTPTDDPNRPNGDLWKLVKMDAFWYDEKEGFTLNDIVEKWAPKRVAIASDNGYRVGDDVYAKFTDRWGSHR